jgi:hypothetical protein
VQLFAWYVRNAHIALLVKAAALRAPSTAEAHVINQAQLLTLTTNIAKAKANVQGGYVAPNLPKLQTPGGLSTAGQGSSSFTPETANLGTIKKVAVAPQASYCWYEVTPNLILKLEKALPAKPSKAPIKLPQGPNLSAQLLAGPKTKWPYARATISNNSGQYVTLWFTIGLAGKNKPGSIIMLKRPAVAGKTPTVPADTGTSDQYTGGDPTGFTPIDVKLPKVDYQVYPVVAPQPVPTGGVIWPQVFPIISAPPLEIVETIPPGFDEPGLELGGENVEETPWYKSPLYIGAVIAAVVGGVWYWKMKK